jgi:hypothetical protein
MTLNQMQVERVPNQAELRGGLKRCCRGYTSVPGQRKRVDGFLMTL